MSRIGKSIIVVPDGVVITDQKGLITVKGPKGTLTLKLDSVIVLKLEAGKAILERKSEEKRFRAMHGLYRSILNNMVIGVSIGFTKELEIQGVGYRASKEGNKLILAMGYSHPVEILPPDGVEFVLDGQTKIKVVGIDKQVVGQVASDIKYVRPVEPYKGKGIRYVGQYVRRKAGKAAAKAGG